MKSLAGRKAVRHDEDQRVVSRLLKATEEESRECLVTCWECVACAQVMTVRKA